LNHEPVSAGPPTVGYKLRKFAKRNKVQVVAVVLVFAALVMGIAMATFGLIRADQQRQIAEENEKKATNAAVAERVAKDREAKQCFFPRLAKSPRRPSGPRHRTKSPCSPVASSKPADDR
jgi:uncharacterized protein HemX